jgi:hypothetical protein
VTKRSKWPVTVIVDVDSADIEEAGYHHEDDCPANQTGNPRSGKPLEECLDAIQLLHELAHPGESARVDLCRQEPCVSLNERGVIPLRRAVA